MFNWYMLYNGGVEIGTHENKIGYLIRLLANALKYTLVKQQDARMKKNELRNMTGTYIRVHPTTETMESSFQRVDAQKQKIRQPIDTTVAC